MKNKHFERCRRSARQHRRKVRRGDFHDGVRALHRYPAWEANQPSWWDDLEILHGGQRVWVEWQHPRHVYFNQIEDAAWAEAERQFPVEPVSRRRALGKHDTQVRRRRKKAVFVAARPDEIARRRNLVFLAEKERLSREADYVIKPSFRIFPGMRGRRALIVAPLEVRTLDDLQQLAALARRLLLRQTTITDEFPGFAYGRLQWQADNPTGTPPGLILHRTAG